MENYWPILPFELVAYILNDNALWCALECAFPTFARYCRQNKVSFHNQTIRKRIFPPHLCEYELIKSGMKKNPYKPDNMCGLYGVAFICENYGDKKDTSKCECFYCYNLNNDEFSGPQYSKQLPLVYQLECEVWFTPTGAIHRDHAPAITAEGYTCYVRMNKKHAIGIPAESNKTCRVESFYENGKVCEDHYRKMRGVEYGEEEYLRDYYMREITAYHSDGHTDEEVAVHIWNTKEVSIRSGAYNDYRDEIKYDAGKYEITLPDSFVHYLEQNIPLSQNLIDIRDSFTYNQNSGDYNAENPSSFMIEHFPKMNNVSNNLLKLFDTTEQTVLYKQNISECDDGNLCDYDLGIKQTYTSINYFNKDSVLKKYHLNRLKYAIENSDELDEFHKKQKKEYLLKDSSIDERMMSALMKNINEERKVGFLKLTGNIIEEYMFDEFVNSSTRDYDSGIKQMRYSFYEDDNDDILKKNRINGLETVVENSDKFYEKQKSKYLQEHDSIDERMIQTWWENFRREQDSLEITDNTTNEQIFRVVFRNSYP